MQRLAGPVVSLVVACGSSSPGAGGSTSSGDAPTSAPSTDPSTDPSAADPSVDPGSSSDPTADPSTDPTTDPTDPTLGDSTGGPPPPDGSDLPIPPGPDDVPMPSGTAGNLHVVDWAGFSSALSYTFDDGQPTHVTHWPALKATGVNVTFFISTGNAAIPGFAEAFMDADASGSEIANHTVHHCNFDAACGDAPAGSHDAELDDADAYITGTLGVAGVWTMAYPFGDVGYHAAAEERYFLGRGTPGGRIAPLDDTDPFNTPTWTALGGESADVMNAVVDQTRANGEWTTLLLHAILPGDNWFAGVDVDAITTNIAHAQSYGDVWIDSYLRVGAYWVGQRVVEDADVAMDGDAIVMSWVLPEHFPPGRFVRITVDGGTVSQGGVVLPWDGHGYYEVALDAGELRISP